MIHLAYILAIFGTGLLCLALGKVIESHKWAQRVRDMKDEIRRLRSVAGAADAVIAATTNGKTAEAIESLADAMDEWCPATVETFGDFERMVG